MLFQMRFAAKAVLVCLAVLIAVILGNVSAFLYQQYLLATVYKPLSVPEPFTPIQFIIHGSSDETISARFFLFDAAGREIASIERSWNGRSLFIECTLVKTDEHRVVFPYRIFTETARLSGSRSGTNLPRYYMDSGVCTLYSSPGQSAAEQEMFNRLARFALKDPFLPDFSQIRSRLVIPLAECERGVLYSLSFDNEGNYYLISE